MRVIQITTKAREEIVDIGFKVAREVGLAGWREGAILIFCTHTTCGLTINESADPAVRRDLIKFFGEVAPTRHGWEHGEGNTDAHIRASLLGSSLLVPLVEGKLVLGTWQAIYLYEGDGPRTRSICLQYLMSPQLESE